MALISVNNLTFGYDGSYNNIFEDVSFNIDTDWKLGLIGRNGKGKTTFLKLLQGKYEYKGKILKNVDIDYFPFEVTNKNRMSIEIINEIAPNIEDWEIIKELNLLKNIDKNEDLKIIPLESNKNPLILANKLQINYNGKAIFKPISFEVNNGDRVVIVGKNGIGKSSILKLIMGKEIQFNGELKKVNDLKISYVSQNTEDLNGNLQTFVRDNEIDESIFKAMLIKMGLSKLDFDTNIQDMSEGQKKKVLIAKSISEQANLYIWDEPLNYIDILTRIQIENAILNCKPTLIFVEHDEAFVQKIATKVVDLEK